MPSTDTYIAKDSSINEEIDKLRLSATASLVERKDVIVVSSVSCIYGLGEPENFEKMMVSLRPGMQKDRDEVVRQLIDIQYDRNEMDFKRGTFRVRGDVLLLESDERYARHTFHWFHPTHFVITNLYRDQLTRNGHPQWVYDAILPAIHPSTTLVLNADDPQVACFAHQGNPVKWFGLEAWPGATKEHHGMYHDGAFCPLCGAPMEYELYHYNHIGHYRCTQCDHHRPHPDFAVTSLDLEAGQLVLDGDTPIQLAFRSIYNVYNILAAWSACRMIGVDKATAAGVINNYILKNGRMVRFTLGQHHGTLLTSKHENSVAYDTNLRYIRDTKTPCSVLVVVDAISRKYFTGETSWLWDIDFDLLAAPHVQRVVLSGRYVNDLALRFACSAVPQDKVVLEASIPQAVEYLEGSGNEDVYVVTCFSDRDKVLDRVEIEEK